MHTAGPSRWPTAATVASPPPWPPASIPSRSRARRDRDDHRGVVAFNADTAIVEVANTCGLSTLPGGVLAPMTASSYGFGEAIRAALTLSRQRLVLALGGSASTDGGIGMLAALGYRFLDRAGELLGPDRGEPGPHPLRGLPTCRRPDGIDSSSPATSPVPARIDRSRRGFRPPERAPPKPRSQQLDTGLENLVGPSPARVSQTPRPRPRLGLGCRRRYRLRGHASRRRHASGAEYFLDLLDFDRLVADADLVITGEGRLDDQTLQGKLPAAVACGPRRRR